ncbi:hypothetical protein SAMN06297251_10152 [Fulvimarina manganoxydans]|uniref:Uncharacterized protein n=1 Tax=Fulvimarina manganoxydans TaxID=937218 RepID=A0A1W1Y8W0_9HYPH|nr:hypothetical protein [Fulvimarina manganoxydans]SMC32597.1 hypothetical protein SAMN06297251_10152 [Fulvimarina manganoxydans]
MTTGWRETWHRYDASGVATDRWDIWKKFGSDEAICRHRVLATGRDSRRTYSSHLVARERIRKLWPGDLRVEVMGVWDTGLTDDENRERIRSNRAWGTAPAQPEVYIDAWETAIRAWVSGHSRKQNYSTNANAHI